MKCSYLLIVATPVFGQSEQSLAGNQRELDLVERELQQMEVSSFSTHLV